MPSFFSYKGDTKLVHSRIAVILFIVLLLIATVGGSQVYVWLVRGERQEAHETLIRTSDNRAVAISDWVKERSSEANFFSKGRLAETASRWLAQDAPQNATKEELREQLEAVQLSHNYAAAGFLDTNGNSYLSTEGTPTRPDQIELDTIRQALASGSLTISSIRTLPHSHERVFDIVSPLIGKNGKILNKSAVLWLRASIDRNPDPFVEKFPSLDTTPQVAVAEIRGNNVVTTASNNPLFKYGAILSLTPAQLIAAEQNRHSSIVWETPNVSTWVSMVRKIEGTPWHTVTVIDQNVIWKNIQRIAWIIVAACVVMLSVLGTWVTLWWRKKDTEYRLHDLEEKTERQLLQQRYNYLSKYANDIIILADAEEKIIEVNDKTLNVLGYQKQDLIDAPLHTLFPHPCKKTLETGLNTLREHGVAVFEIFQQKAVGHPLPVEVSARSIKLDGKKFIQFICRDVTERKEVEKSLKETKNRLNDILESILDVVWSFSADFSHLYYINSSVERIHGYPVASFFEKPSLWLDAIHPEDVARVDHAIQTLGPEHTAYEVEYRIMRKDGAIRWLHCRAHLVLNQAGKPLRLNGVSSDITERKTAEQQVQLLAYYDSVTLLPNRTLLGDRLEQATHVALRNNQKVALLFMDLDNFKYVNDSLGHHVGDMLLRGIAERLLDCVRDEDTVARIGGDEFLVVLPDLDKAEQAVPVADKILNTMAQPFSLSEHQVYSTISIGISIFPDDGKTAGELIKHADSALYQAKNLGRNRYQFFTSEIHRQITRSTSIENQLRQAIHNKELSLWYQPQIDSMRGKLIGAEALLRWHRRGAEFMSPVEFIPVAEERGLIATIGEWVLREACAQSQQWVRQGLPPIPIAVNVSALQFQQKGFSDNVIDTIREFNVDPNFLELEITESAIMRKASLVAELAMRLRDEGIGISIDDFGTGYSSLSYLKQIPIDKIKIDRSFIAEMMTDADNEAITQAIITLARSLKLRVIAEDVESHAQLQQLRMFGCNEVQGYYYSPAVAAHTFGNFLKNSRMFPQSAWH